MDRRDKQLEIDTPASAALQHFPKHLESVGTVFELTVGQRIRYEVGEEYFSEYLSLVIRRIVARRRPELVPSLVRQMLWVSCQRSERLVK